MKNKKQLNDDFEDPTSIHHWDIDNSPVELRKGKGKRCNILVFIGCRSDEGLSAPIIKRLEKDPFFNCSVQPLYPAKYGKTFRLCRNIFTSFNNIDVALITGDRIEMMAAATACFLNHIPIAHLYAGITGDFATYDGIFRHCITLMSDVQLCEDKTALDTVDGLFDAIGKERFGFITGITHLDDLEVDESLVPQKDYNLVLYNSFKGNILHRFDKHIIKEMTQKHTIYIGNNPDRKDNIWKEDIINNELRDYKYYDNLPRPQFLGLLKNCERFISNSSTAYYEAPHFLDEGQIIMVGHRNEKRSTDFSQLQTGGSERTIDALKNWWRERQEHG